MPKITEPKSKIAKVLHALIAGRAISERDFKINSFRSILSDLRNAYGIPIRHVKETSKDEFGKPSWYYRHFTLVIDRPKCRKVYKTINH